MKKTYVRPTAVAENFVANDYCAVCGKTPGGKYLFTCDAPAGTVYIPSGSGYRRLGGYHPCGAKHETEGTSGYYDGFVDYNSNGKLDAGEERLIWVERDWFGGVSNYHASSSLTRGMVDVERS
ncbi:MAG: hypothetical protein MJ097_02555 [Dorea sp.]|nr:hypothetical protein [Dorea sp.]